MRKLGPLLIITVLLAGASAAFGQVGIGVPVANAPGVVLDADGKVRSREIDSRDQLTAMRARMRAAGSAKDSALSYVSLPHVLSQLHDLKQAGKDVPDAVRFPGGLTQIRYVFVFAEEKDLVIAGPGEAVQITRAEGDATEYAVGKRSGRPIIQLDDLITALRTSREGRGQVFGCGIYPSPDSLKIADGIAKRLARGTRAQRMQAMRDELGPQEIRIFGTRNDTRLAYICVAADYELKRYALGLDQSLVPGVGNPVDASRSAANKFWFEASYDPLLVSKDSNAYEFRGSRLLVRAGGFDFDVRGATEKAKTFAGQFTKNMTALATAEPLFAELQNITDAALLANLVRRDKLAEKIGWDNAWIYDDKQCPVAQVPVPRTADTLVNYTNGSIVAGGVTLTMDRWVGDKSRETDDKQTLAAARDAALAARQAAGSQGAGPAIR